MAGEMRRTPLFVYIGLCGWYNRRKLTNIANGLALPGNERRGQHLTVYRKAEVTQNQIAKRRLRR